MKEMEWKVCWSIKYNDGTINEDEVITVQARTIRLALERAEKEMYKRLKADPGIDKMVIWDIGVFDWDVFEVDET